MKQENKSLEPDPLIPFVEEIQSVTFSPRFQIIVTNGVLEMLVNTLIEKKCKNHKKLLKFTYANKLLLINEMGIITDMEFKTLNAFRDLRNEAAHGSFTLASDWIKPFESIIHFKEPNKTLKNVSIHVVFHFWNDHWDVFYHYFNPLATHA